MVSLVNGNTDVMGTSILDFVGMKYDSKKKHDEGSFEEESSNGVWYRVVPRKLDQDSSSVEVSEVINETTGSSLVENGVPASESSEEPIVNSGKDLCIYPDTSLSPSSANSQTLVNDNRSNPPDPIDTTPISAVSANISNLVFVGNLKNMSKSDNQHKVYLLNSSILTKNAGETLVEKNLNDVIKKMKVVSSNTDGTAVKNIATVPSFVQLSQSNMKNISKNITLNVAPNSANSILLKPNSQSYEILRAKLMENKAENAEPALIEIPTDLPKHKAIMKTVNAPLSASVSKASPESLAVLEARNELIKCRKKLIQAALFPTLNTKVPLPGYVGPTFSCEECEDTFVTEDSLKNHKDRRSVLFTYDCPSCKQTLEFYNRCMFLLHVRSHDSAVKACFLTISTIPASKLKFRVLDADEELPTEVEERQPVEIPSVVVSSTPTLETRKVVLKSVEKSADLSAVRIVKSLKKKKQQSTTTAGENTNNDSVNGESSSLRQLLTSDKEPVTVKSPPGISKSNDVNASIPEPPKSPIRKRKNSTEDVSKSLNKSISEPSSVEEVSHSSEIISTEKKRETKIEPSARKREPKVETSTVGNNSEEITLTSSDEEEDSVPDSNDKSKLVTCRECKKDVSNLTRHYRGDNRPKKEYLCHQCKYLNSSACALSAHVRMHSKMQPYVCPDCGYFFSTLETFLVHVKQVCFYDFKAIRFKCPECSILKPSVPKFAEHLRREHTREVFKCDACMTSSYSYVVVEAHIKKMHPNPEKISILEGYWCKLCPSMLVSKPMISHHINKHVCSLQYLRYVYICKTCKTYGSSHRSKFSDHYHNICSSESPEVILEPKIKKPTRTRKRLESRMPEESKGNCKSNKTEIKISQKDITTKNSESDKAKEEFEATENICVMCRKTKMSEHSSLFCQQCVRLVNDEDTNSTGEITSSGGNSRLKRKFKCKLCKQCMNRDWSTITKHFEKNHHSDFDVRTKMRPSTFDSNLVVPNRKRKMTVKTPDNAKILKPDLKYKCAKCNIITNDRKQFHEHIVSHKSSTDFQCLECGICFIVGLSLEKHLIVEHKIRHGDLKEYFKENGIVEVEEKVDDRTLVEHQCEVCYLECGTKQNYDKHIRTHGMAFVAMQSKAKT